MSRLKSHQRDRTLPDPNLEPTITITRAGQILGMGRTTAYAAARDGRFPTIAISPARLVVITADFLEAVRPAAGDPMSRPPRSMSPAELAQALDSGIARYRPDDGIEAGVRLLIAHGSWLSRDELRRHIQVITTTGPELLGWIDWRDLAAEPDRSRASASERAILRLACSLAGYLPDPAAQPWSVADMLSCLGTANALTASRAIAMVAIGPEAVGKLL